MSDSLFGEERSSAFAFHWFVTCVMSVVICITFLLVSLAGCILWLIVADPGLILHYVSVMLLSMFSDCHSVRPSTIRDMSQTSKV